MEMDSTAEEYYEQFGDTPGESIVMPTGNLFETYDYIVVQSENALVSVYDKTSGMLIFSMQYTNRSSKEQLRNMVEDFQRRRDFTRKRAII